VPTPSGRSSESSDDLHHSRFTRPHRLIWVVARVVSVPAWLGSGLGGAFAIADRLLPHAQFMNLWSAWQDIKEQDCD
jgi:hypothetical protein